jgi:hypothetical protein
MSRGETRRRFGQLATGRLVVTSQSANHGRSHDLLDDIVPFPSNGDYLSLNQVVRVPEGARHDGPCGDEQSYLC